MDERVKTEYIRTLAVQFLKAHRDHELRQIESAGIYSEQTGEVWRKADEAGITQAEIMQWVKKWTRWPESLLLVEDN